MKKALKTATDWAKELNESTVLDEITLLKNRYKSNEKSKRKGTILISDYGIEANRIADALLKVLEEWGGKI